MANEEPGGNWVVAGWGYENRSLGDASEFGGDSGEQERQAGGWLERFINKQGLCQSPMPEKVSTQPLSI